jgi:hypothetical protein
MQNDTSTITATGTNVQTIPQFELPIPARTGFRLTVHDKQRLQNLAPHFNIGFELRSNVSWSLYPNAHDRTGEIVLDADIAHRRLLTEMCSRAARWLHFALGSSCRDTLLGLSDSRLQRIAQLYTEACLRSDN